MMAIGEKVYPKNATLGCGFWVGHIVSDNVNWAPSQCVYHEKHKIHENIYKFLFVSFRIFRGLKMVETMITHWKGKLCRIRALFVLLIFTHCTVMAFEVGGEIVRIVPFGNKEMKASIGRIQSRLNRFTPRICDGARR